MERTAMRRPFGHIDPNVPRDPPPYPFKTTQMTQTTLNDSPLQDKSKSFCRASDRVVAPTRVLRKTMSGRTKQTWIGYRRIIVEPIQGSEAKGNPPTDDSEFSNDGVNDIDDICEVYINDVPEIKDTDYLTISPGIDSLLSESDVLIQGWDLEDSDADLTLVIPRQKLKCMVQELFATERRYIDTLGLINTNFLTPIKQQSMLPDDAIRTIFGNFDEILSLNKMLLSLMTKDGVIKAFTSIAPYLKSYAIYAQNFEAAVNVIPFWANRSSMFRKLKADHNRSKNAYGISLEGLLIAPVQRMPRYEMLLSGISKLTTGDDWGSNALLEVVRAVKEINQHINSYMKAHDIRAKLVAFQKQLVGLDRAARLVSPGRELIREGVLHKQSQSKNQIKPRLCFLCSDLFLYATKIPGMFGEKSYRFRKALWLWKCTVRLDVNVRGVQTIVIQHANGILEFHADTLESTASWYHSIQEAIRADVKDKTHRQIGESGATEPLTLNEGTSMSLTHRLNNIGSRQPRSSTCIIS